MIVIGLKHALPGAGIHLYRMSKVPEGVFIIGSRGDVHTRISSLPIAIFLVLSLSVRVSIV